MNLSPNFTLEELTRSQTATRYGMDNTPHPIALKNLRRLAYQLEIIRMIVGRPIVITSGYRSPELNQKIGGARNSDHMQGCAADFVVSGLSVSDIVERIRDVSPFVKIIDEFGRWVHVSINPVQEQHVLRATKKQTGVSYERI